MLLSTPNVKLHIDMKACHILLSESFVDASRMDKLAIFLMMHTAQAVCGSSLGTGRPEQDVERLP